MKKISLQSVLREILARPNVASRQPIFDKYDKNVQGNTAFERGQVVASIITPFKDFPELSASSADTGVVVGTGGNPYRAKVSPGLAAEYAICEGALKTKCVGGDWLGATDCLNFGNPEKEDQMAELVEGIEGVKSACENLGIPIVSGNVSLYNESSGNSIPPSALVSVFARVDDLETVKPIQFQGASDSIWYLGLGKSLVGSELLNLVEAEDTNLESIDYSDFEALCEDVKAHLSDFNSINVIGAGGAWAALVAGAANTNYGFDLALEADPIAALLGEGLGVVVTTKADLSNIDGAQCLGQTNASGNVKVVAGEDVVFESNTTELVEPWKAKLTTIF